MSMSNQTACVPYGSIYMPMYIPAEIGDRLYGLPGPITYWTFNRGQYLTFLRVEESVARQAPSTSNKIHACFMLIEQNIRQRLEVASVSPGRSLWHTSIYRYLKELRYVSFFATYRSARKSSNIHCLSSAVHWFAQKLLKRMQFLDGLVHVFQAILSQIGFESNICIKYIDTEYMHNNHMSNLPGVPNFILSDSYP